MIDYAGLQQAVFNPPPVGWVHVHTANGLYLWPFGLRQWRNEEHNRILRDWQMLFELHSTPTGYLRLLARMRFYGNGLGDEFQSVQRAAHNLRCQEPRPTRLHVATRSVAIWPIQPQIHAEGGDRFEGFGRGEPCGDDVVNSVRAFFTSPPQSLIQFINYMRVFIENELAIYSI